MLLSIGVVLALLLTYQATRPDAHNTNEQQTSIDTSVANVQDQPLANSNLDIAVRTLAEFQADQITNDKPAVSQITRNLFSNTTSAVAAPLPTAISPPAPPIQLLTCEPSRIFVQVHPFDLIVRGVKFKSGWKIYINGSAEKIATTFVSSEQLQARLPAVLLSQAQSLRIEVKAPGNESKLFSNPLTVVVAPPPLPAFSFIGQISEEGGDNPRIVLSEKRDRLIVVVGDVVQERWRILDLVGDYLELEDVELGVRHRLKKGDAPLAAQSNSLNVATEATKQIPTVSEKETQPMPPLFNRPAQPMTYQELLKRRAEAARQRHK
ncbi:MAG: hypothetical protein AB1489_04210 [Acidobacteriota bacterium]